MAIPLRKAFAALLFFLTLSCSKERPGEGVGTAIGFSASVEAAASKSISGEMTSSGLKTSGFGVFACYTGFYLYREKSVTSDFMYNEQITWDSANSVWTYSPLKYWPNGEGEALDGAAGTDIPHRVSFFAYAPYSDGSASTPAGYCIPSTVYPTEESDPWILYRLHPDPQKQVDLLCADPQLNLSKSGVEDKIAFRFHHALACVGDNFTVSASAALQTQLKNTVDAGIIGADEVRLTLTDVSVTYTLTQKARLVLWNQGQPNWQPVLSEAPMTTRTFSLLSGASVELYRYDGSTQDENTWADSGSNALLFIPLEVAGNTQTAAIALQYTLEFLSGGVPTDTRAESGLATVVLRDAGYSPGERLDIHVRLQPRT